MPIPVFKKAVDASSLATGVKPLPPLAAVHINPSRSRIFFYRASYGAFAASLLWAFYPFILGEISWLLGLVLCWYFIGWDYRRQTQRDFTGALSFFDNHWLHEQQNSVHRLELAGAVLCWRWLIVLPMRNSATGQVRRLILFSNALSRSDNARLRRWLRACLKPRV